MHELQPTAELAFSRNPDHQEEEHYSHRANWLRAAVLGANDGLVSVASIMLGVGAASQDQHTLLLSGLSALVAGEGRSLCMHDALMLWKKISPLRPPMWGPCGACVK